MSPNTFQTDLFDVVAYIRDNRHQNTMSSPEHSDGMNVNPNVTVAVGAQKSKKWSGR